MILHGKDLIVSIDGNANMASKSCTLNVSAKSIVKTSPTSGDWEEVLSGKKSWNLTTNHLVKEATAPSVILSGDPDKFFFSNSRDSGWVARGQYGDSDYYAFDLIGIEEGIYLLEIDPTVHQTTKVTMFNKDGEYGSTNLKNYLAGEATIGGSSIDEDCMIAIMTVGEFVLDTYTCNILNGLYQVALPCMEFGISPLIGPKTYDTTPVIIVGGRTGVLSYGYVKTNSIANDINFTLYGGKQVPAMDGIPGAIDMVGRLVNIRMTDNNGSTWLGQAIVTQFKVTGTKGNLMAGSFSFKGNGELQVDKNIYNVTPIMPDKIINRIVIDMTKSNPDEMITGDVDGAIINDILDNFHRYLCKYRGSGYISICQLDDNNSNFFYDGTPATLDGTEGDVYVSCQKLVAGTQSEFMGFFYSIIYLGEGKVMFSVTNATQYSGMRYWSETNFIAAFRAQPTTDYDNAVAGVAGGTYYLRSIANGQPVFADTFANLDTAIAKMNPNYFGKVGPEEHAIIALLYYMKFGNPNSQAICGVGGLGQATGASAIMGMRDTDATTGTAFVNLFGLEDWWRGGEGEYMERIKYENGKIYTRPWGSQTWDEGTAISTPLANEETVIRNMLFRENPLMMIPAGSQSPQSKDWGTYFCDGVRIPGHSEIVTRGKGDDALSSGIAAMKLGRNTLPEDTDATRLCFRTTTIKVERCRTDDFANRTIEDPAA